MIAGKQVNALHTVYNENYHDRRREYFSQVGHGRRNFSLPNSTKGIALMNKVTIAATAMIPMECNIFS